MSYHYDAGIRDPKTRTHVFIILPDWPAKSKRVYIGRLRFNSDEAVETLTLTRKDIPRLIQTLQRIAHDYQEVRDGLSHGQVKRQKETCR